MDNTLNEAVRGNAAQQLLDNEIYKEAITKVHDGILNAMKSAPMGDEKTHNRLVIALQLLAQIERHIEDIANTGRMARIQMEEKSLRNKIRKIAGF